VALSSRKSLSIHKDNRCMSTYDLAVANLP
jgi:hypothetical protein